MTTIATIRIAGISSAIFQALFGYCPAMRPVEPFTITWARVREIQDLEEERRRLERARAVRTRASRGGVTAGPGQGLRAAWDSPSLLDLLKQIKAVTVTPPARTSAPRR